VLAIPEEETVYEDGAPVPPYGVAVTRQGLAFRFPLFPHREPSTRAGRKFARLNEGDEVLHVFTTAESDDGWVVAASTDGHAIAVDLEEVALLSGPGKGTMLIKLEADASVLAARIARRSRGEPLTVFTEGGKKHDLQAEDVEALRGTRGKQLVKRGGFASAELPPPEVPMLARDESKGG
jgi:DNA gyrase subunit A